MSKVLQVGKIIDGNGNELKNKEIKIKEEKIVEINDEVKKDEKDTVKNFKDKIMIPGMIDSHLHYAMNGEPSYEEMFLEESVPFMTLKAVNHARKDLEMGFTTVRDMGAPGGLALALRDAINEEHIKGPRILASGPALSISSGHGDWYSEWVDLDEPLSVKADGKKEVRKTVRKQIHKGADNIKVMASGGVMDKGSEPGAPEYSVEEMKVAVKEAEKRGLPTGAHAQGTSSIKNALKAGISSIDHGIYLDKEAVKMMKEKEKHLVPTLAAPNRIVEYGTEAGILEHAVEKAKKVKQSHEESFKMAIKNNVKIAMGTDIGTPFNKHGENAYELELMVKLGMTEMEAIQSTTKEPAKLLRIKNKLGTIEENKIADLVILEKDPLKDITILQKEENITSVYKKGKKQV